MSTSRFCQVRHAIDGKWYLLLADNEGDWFDDDQEGCPAYGPFSSEKSLEKEFEFHEDAGSTEYLDGGTAPIPREVRRPLSAG